MDATKNKIKINETEISIQAQAVETKQAVDEIKTQQTEAPIMDCLQERVGTGLGSIVIYDYTPSGGGVYVFAAPVELSIEGLTLFVLSNMFLLTFAYCFQPQFAYIFKLDRTSESQKSSESTSDSASTSESSEVVASSSASSFFEGVGL